MNWLTVRNFGTIKYFNLSYVVIIGVPLAVEAYRGMQFMLTSIELTTRFPTTFKALYLASLSYAIAVAIYQFFCPSIIKRYESEDLYVKAMRPLYEDAYPDKKLEIVMANLAGPQEDLLHLIVQLKATTEADPSNDAARGRLIQTVNDVFSSCVQRFLINNYRAAQRENPVAIGASTLCYAIGTIVLAYHLVLRTLSVIRA